MRTATILTYEERILCAIEFILESLDASLSAPEIAAHAGFSQYHFGRVFQSAVGERISEFVRRLRLERSAHELTSTRTSITEIAFSAGYESLESYSRAFRAAYLMTPSDYRKGPTRQQLSAPSEVHYCPTGKWSSPVLRLQQGEDMIVEFVTLAPKRILGLEHRGPYHLIGSSFDQLFPELASLGIAFNEVLGVFYDDPGTVPAAELRSQAAVAVAEGVALPQDYAGTLRIHEIPGGTYAVASVLGPYEGLSDAWARFCGQAIPEAGRPAQAGPCFEVYMNDCSKVAPSEVRTDLYAPVE